MEIYQFLIYNKVTL